MKPIILPSILAIIFLLSGGAKLAGLAFEVEAFSRWGFPIWFMYLTGILEVTGGAGLLWPRFSALAAACLACLMLGAIMTHLIHSEWVMLVIATSIMLLAVWHGWQARDDIKQLYKRIRN